MECPGQIVEIAEATTAKSFSIGLKWSITSGIAKLEASILAAKAVGRAVTRTEKFARDLCKRQGCECGKVKEEFLPAIETFTPAKTYLGFAWGGTWKISYAVKVTLACTDSDANLS